MPAGDIGRRLVSRREELGLSVEDVADRTDIPAGYLRYVESQPTAAPGLTFLERVADALDTSISRLRGGGVDLPEGTGVAAARPTLLKLTPEQCQALMSTHGVGRVAVTTTQGPAILPVNYAVVDGGIVFRTGHGSAAALSDGVEAAFEVDQVDEARSEGWSVLAVGPARRVTDVGAVEEYERRAHTKPWAGGDRDLWVRIDPVRLTGRRIEAS
ncbi:helix-turn-helix domain-containing protein [Streptomyces griseoviridis]|uniref:helix-turn-helix domain-containing protein n=1 Tax=Streptomyces griseoviridis TaxID=45398 RepID=UPI0034542884